MTALTDAIDRAAAASAAFAKLGRRDRIEVSEREGLITYDRTMSGPVVQRDVDIEEIEQQLQE